jgi:hypothetical protein
VTAPGANRGVVALMGQGRFAPGFALRFARPFAPWFTAAFAPVFAPALTDQRVAPGHQSYEWHVTATTCGQYGGKSVWR